ncbi:hypothetical protein Bca101_088479 [Brassica carinata]
MAGRGRGKKKSQQRKSTKRNSVPVEEQHVEEFSTGNDSDDLSARGNESYYQSASSQEVNRKVEKMNKRLGKIESCQVVLKKRCKRMKAMEKKLEKIEDCQYYLKKKAKKVEKEMKKMKEKEEDNETNEGFDYQGMDYNWGGQRNDINGVDATTKEPEDADMVENIEVVEEKESEEEKEPDEVQDEVEMNETNEIEEEVETEARVEAEKMVEEEVEEHEEEAEKMVEEEVEEPEEEAGKMVEKEVEEPEEEAEEMVEDEVEEPEKETEKYTEEENSCETKEADKGTAKPYGTGVKHRLKQMALRKQAPKQAPKKAPKPRGRPRKATQPKKFTTPEQTKRIRSRSQWVSTPFTEANTDEIEGRKKKHITKA